MAESDVLISDPTMTEVASLSLGSSSCTSPAEIHKIQVANEQFFLELIKSQPPPEPMDFMEYLLKNPPQKQMTELSKILNTSAFFIDFGGRLEVGKKIAQGGQAKIYEALFDGEEAFNAESSQSGSYVLKVFPLRFSEQFKHAWAKESERIYIRFNDMWKGETCCFATNCTLLKDGRFAFLIKRYWGDLRKAINEQELKGNMPPFPLSISTNIMYQIARGVRVLHGKGILHRDLKASNVLVNGDIEKCMRHCGEVKGELFYCHVADFESVELVMGTGFWRAPEVLGILRSLAVDKYSNPTIWTEKVDVYSYGMTCYEVLSGCIPFKGRRQSDYNIGDERPPLPDYLDQEIQELLKKCWASEPSERPSFEIICNELERFSGKKMKYCKALAEDEIDDEAKRWLSWPFHFIDETGARQLRIPFQYGQQELQAILFRGA